MATEVSADSIMNPDQYRAVSTPSEAATKLKQTPRNALNFLKQNVPPTAAMMGGSAAGEALGAAVAPETGGLSIVIPALAAALGAGGGNLAASKLLPPEYGGQPDQSKTAAFLWGAVPELALGGPGIALGRKAAGIVETAPRTGLAEELRNLPAKTGETAEAGLEKRVGRGATELRESVGEMIKGEPPTTGTVSRLAQTLGKPQAPRALEEGGGKLANQYRDAVTGPINRLRDRYGSRIGAAYDALKGRTEPADLGDLPDAVTDIRGSMAAPLSPKAQALFNQAENLGKRSADRPRTMLDRPEGLEHIGDTEHYLAENLQKSGRQPSGAEIEFGARRTLPTIDDVRELRQKVQSLFQKTTEGGDKRGLRLLRQQLDDKLVNYLPENMSGLREDYKNFIRRFPYRSINALDAMHNPAQIAQFAFGQSPEIARDLILTANASEKDALRQSFANRVMQGVDPRLPVPQQMAAIRKELGPYVQDGTVGVLYGKSAQKELEEVMYAPLHRQHYASLLEAPRGQRAFETGAAPVLRRADATRRGAAEAGLESFVNTLSPEERSAFIKVRDRFMERSALPAPEPVLGARDAAQKAIRERLMAGTQQGSVKRMVGYAGRRAMFAAPYAAGMMAMGRGAGAGYAAATMAAFGTFAATEAGYRAMMKLGGADVAAKLYASPSGRWAAERAFDALAAIGSRAGQGLANAQESP